MASIRLPSLLLWICLFGLFGACGGQAEKKAEEELDGAALSKIYCSSCHIYPEPAALDQSTWKNFVLVRMGAFMGIYHDTQKYYDSLPHQWIEPGIGGQRVKDAQIYPAQPLLSRPQWEAIRDFYLQNAPIQTSGPISRIPISRDLAQFNSQKWFQQAAWAPYVQAIQIDSSRGEILISMYQQEILRLDKKGKLLEQIPSRHNITDIAIHPNGNYSFADMGDRRGVDSPTGSLTFGKGIAASQKNQAKLRLDSLQRPVHMQWADLNEDGLEDVILCEFGNLLGQLAWYEQLPDQGFEKHVLMHKDGATRTEYVDLDGNGHKDIIVLMANGDEGIDVYLNQGKGVFKRQRLLRFPSTYGSTHFQLVDFDQDGQMDILYANGDNGDYPPILKEHHGIRLYRNTGNLQFEATWFLPQNGTYQAEAADFDLDGDLDVVSVAYHADFSNHPEEAFVYWENQGGGAFSAHTIPEVDLARWMRFDIGDLDRDGDPDIVLGAFNAKSTEVPDSVWTKWESALLPIVFLENRAR